MSKLDSSGIRKVFDLAQNLHDPVNLSIGQPDFDVPQAVKESAIEAIRNGANRYTVTQGINTLREKLLAKAKAECGVQTDHILITSGVSGALMLAFLVLVDPGDEVLIPDPYFVMYKHLVNLSSGVPRFVDTYPDFHLTAGRIEPLLSPRSKVLVLNSPANPTGAVVGEQDLRDIADLAKAHGLVVISDEIYRFFRYESPVPSIARIYENTLFLDGFSKSHAMTGWRLGYAIGPEPIIAEMTKLQQFSFVCAPSFAQEAAVKALEVDTRPYVEAYRRKRDMIYEGLKDRYEIVKPASAFYVFPKVPRGTGQDFVAKAIESNLLVIPGNVFSEQDSHFRIAYAADAETIRRGIEILRKLA